MTAIIFIIVLAILILVHEFGHFITAKKLKIRVDEFGLGFPPKLWGKKFGETVYTLNWIPFGGFVKIFGENPDEESISGPDSARSFYNKPKWAQAIVLAGGVFFNFVFAWILIAICFIAGANVGRDDFSKYENRFSDENVSIVSISDAMPAREAGLKLGDYILAIKTVDAKNPSDFINVKSSRDVMATIASSSGKDLVFKVLRNSNEEVATVTPKKGLIVSDKDRYAVGIAMSDAATLSLPIHLALYESAKYTLILIKDTATGLYGFFSQIFVGKADFSTVSGPVGIAGMVGDAARSGFVKLFLFTAIISINLGVINLAPFPALDGGRLLFLAIEAISRKKIPVKVANAVNGIGFIILLALMLVITYRDVIKLILAR